MNLGESVWHLWTSHESAYDSTADIWTARSPHNAEPERLLLDLLGHSEGDDGALIAGSVVLASSLELLAPAISFCQTSEAGGLEA